MTDTTPWAPKDLLRDTRDPVCSPTVAEGKVVPLGLRGVLSCYDVASGKLLWRKEDFKGAWHRFFTSASPLVAKGLCVAVLGGPGNGGVIAYDVASGDEKWRWTGDGAAYASPVLLTVDIMPYGLTQTDTKMVALALADGKLAWETPFVVQGRGYNAATPIVEGDMVIDLGSGRGATAINLEKQGSGLAAKELARLKVADSPTYAYPVVSGNRLFIKDQEAVTLWTVD